MTDKLKLVRMTLFRKDDGRISTNVTFSGFGNTLEMKLDEELGAKIVDLCFDEIIKSVAMAQETFVSEALALVAADNALVIEDAKPVDPNWDIPF